MSLPDWELPTEAELARRREHDDHTLARALACTHDRWDSTSRWTTCPECGSVMRPEIGTEPDYELLAQDRHARDTGWTEEP